MGDSIVLHPIVTHTPPEVTKRAPSRWRCSPGTLCIAGSEGPRGDFVEGEEAVVGVLARSQTPGDTWVSVEMLRNYWGENSTTLTLATRRDFMTGFNSRPDLTIVRPDGSEVSEADEVTSGEVLQVNADDDDGDGGGRGESRT